VVDPFRSERGARLRGLFVDSSERLVVWGNESVLEAGNTGNVPMFWSTADTVGWRKTRLGTVGDGILLDEVAYRTQGYVAVGSAGDSIAAWWSPDGESWSAATIDPLPVRERAGFTAVSDGADGYLAVGSDAGLAAAWFSPNGQTWTKIEADFPAGDFWNVTRSPDGGFVVVGEDRSEGDWNAMAWVVSPDGVGWRAAESDDALAGPGDDDISRIWSFAGGYAGFGHEVNPPDRPCGPCRDLSATWRLYTSPDGLAWTRFAIDFETAGEPYLIEYDAVEAWADGLVAVGSGSDGELHIWLSSDGTAWSSIGDPIGLAGGPARGVADLLIYNDTLVVAGSGRDEYVAIASDVTGTSIR
jgi:hypothetical protein